MKKIMTMVLTLALAVFALAGCVQEGGNTADATRTPAPKDIMDAKVDALGNEVKEAGQGAVMTVVSTAPSVTEILFELGCGSEIIGVDISSDYPAETADIEKVGDFNGLDIEKIIAKAPDIVFAGNGLQHESIEKLQEVGINVVAAEPTYFNDIENSISLIGMAVGRQSEAAQLNAQIASAVEIVKQKAAGLSDRPSVYYVMGIGEYGNWTSGEGSFINDVMEMAGGECVTAGSPTEWMDYPIEDLIIKDPDILIISSYIAEDDLLAQTGYKDLSAIKNKQYYFIDPSIIERPGPRITQALELIQEFLLGE